MSNLLLGKQRQVARQTSRLLFSEHAAKYRKHGEHEKNVKQNLGDTCSAGSDIAEAQDGSDDRDDEKDNCIMQHGDAPVGSRRAQRIDQINLLDRFSKACWIDINLIVEQSAGVEESQADSWR